MITAKRKFLLGYKNCYLVGGMSLWWGESTGGIFPAGEGNKQILG